MPNTISPDQVQLINEATPVSSLDNDFFLIGWQGTSEGYAPLICLSSSQLRSYIQNLISEGAAGASLMSMAPSAPVAKLSVEEFFDEIHNQTKDMFVQFEITQGADGSFSASVKSHVNCDAQVVLVSEVSDGVYHITTNIETSSLVQGTAQLTMESAIPMLESLDLSGEYVTIAVCLEGPCLINLSAKIPLVGEGVQLQTVQE